MVNGSYDEGLSMSVLCMFEFVNGCKRERERECDCIGIATR